MRAIRKGNYLLIWNQKPDVWPAGHPSLEYNFNYYPYGDVDNSPSKDFILGLSASDHMSLYYDLCFGKRPEYELYCITEDTFQMNNLAGKAEYSKLEQDLKQELAGYLRKRGDLRLSGKEEVYRDAPYFGMKGLESGGMDPANWKALSEEGRQIVLKREKARVEVNRKKLKEMGWKE